MGRAVRGRRSAVVRLAQGQTWSDMADRAGVPELHDARSRHAKADRVSAAMFRMEGKLDIGELEKA